METLHLRDEITRLEKDYRAMSVLRACLKERGHRYCRVQAEIDLITWDLCLARRRLRQIELAQLN